MANAATENKAQQTIEYWQGQIIENPSKALNYFNLGVVFHNKNSFSLAILNYNKVIELNSKLTPVALYYQALAYERLNQIDKTKNILIKIKTESLTPELKAEVLAYKNKIFANSKSDDVVFQEKSADAKSMTDTPERAAEEKRLSLFFDYNKGQNSNPDNLATLVVADMQSQLKLGIDYLIDYTKYYDIKGNYYFSSTSYEQFVTSNYVYHDLTAPLSFYLFSFRVKLTPEFLIDYYDNTLFSNQTGLTLDLSYKAQDNYFSFLAQTNNITNKTASASYLTGFENKFQLELEQNWSGSKIDYKIYFSDYHYVDTPILPSSYRAYGLTVGYSQPVFFLEGSFSGTFESKSYLKVNPNPLARQDQRFSIDFNLSYDFLTYFRVYLDGSYASNQSNLNSQFSNKNYSQNLILLGLTITN